MKIKEGFNGKPTEVRVASQDNGSIELWIEETGRLDQHGNTIQTLSYLSLDELHKLFKEIKIAGKDLFD